MFNHQLANQVINHLENLIANDGKCNDRFSMKTYFFQEKTENGCGTTACIAGWIVYLTFPSFILSRTEFVRTVSTATKALSCLFNKDYSYYPDNLDKEEMAMFELFHKVEISPQEALDEFKLIVNSINSRS